VFQGWEASVVDIENAGFKVIVPDRQAVQEWKDTVFRKFIDGVPVI
jgi:hypothetical protein